MRAGGERESVIGAGGGSSRGVSRTGTSQHGRRQQQLSVCTELGPGAVDGVWRAVVTGPEPSMVTPLARSQSNAGLTNASPLTTVSLAKVKAILRALSQNQASIVFRKPVDPIALGVRPGLVVSEHVGYLEQGIRHGLVQNFIDKSQVQHSQQPPIYPAVALTLESQP